MPAVLRALHVLAVALWFGAMTFFTVAGVLIFQAFTDTARLEGEARPSWLPLPALYSGEGVGSNFPDPLRLEQGNRAAGVAVSSLFTFYYALQAGCGVVVLVTALALPASGRRPLRVVVAALALATALGGWWLETEVSRLRGPRNALTDAALAGKVPFVEANAARATFGRWHGYSLIQNFTTLTLTAWLVLLVPSACREER